MDFEDSVKALFPNIEVKNKGQFLIMKICEQGISLKLKPNSYIDQGFENFAIVESCRKLKIEELFNLDEDRLQLKYNDYIENDIGEFLVFTKPNCKKYKIRTVIHCLEEHIAEMFRELSGIHLKIHSKVLEELGS